MVNHPKWPAGVVYVDLFAGPGICTIERTGERFPGSPLIAAGVRKPFRKILLCELRDPLAEACENRLRQRLASSAFEVFRGDCNERVVDLIKCIPSGALTLAFLDPTGLHLNLDTVQTLASRGAVDLLILFPDAVDVLRNADHLYFPDEASALDRVLGLDSDWRVEVLNIPAADGASRRRMYANIYRRQLERRAGYKFFDDVPIKDQQGRPLYRLVYATKNPTGLAFWDESVKRKLGGERRLF